MEGFNSEKVDDEMKALGSVVTTLEEITDEAERARILRYVIDRFAPPRAARKGRPK